ncbi:hypothetical protein M8C17_03935 [Micromonospora sp. RHAY321]|uniref:hypothetical protein n=1 Tax=Micromonospora sp. RHAY321 TaxID=2944807 RepID=UPI00207C8AD9|nr:hypothetical protein [Micromonospora sp. RHAY321]MCO1594307.1 hypothetical protein [Micromonospora sp. RHAY321]
MRGAVAGGLIGLCLPLFPLGLATLVVADGVARLVGAAAMLVAVAMAVGWWYLAGRHDGAADRVGPRRHLLLSLAALGGVEFVLIGLGWSAAVGGWGKAIALAWIAVGVALFAAFWRKVVPYYVDEPPGADGDAPEQR